MAGSIALTSVTQVDIAQTSANPIFVKKYLVDWTGDASGGSVPTLSIEINGWVVKAVTIPGSTAPTTLYDIALNDPDAAALDALGTALKDRSATVAEQVYPVIAGVPSTTGIMPPLLAGTYSLAVTNNSVNSATGKIILYVVDRI